MGLLDRIAAVQRQQPVESRFSVDQWIRDYLTPASFQFGGTTYPLGLNTTWGDRRTQEISNTLPGYAAALRQSPPAFAAQMVRSLVLSQARFTFRNLPSTPTPRRTFGNRDLQILERPWPNATTGELVARMEWHAGLAGNAFVVRQQNRLRVLRPDWVVIIYGSDQEPDEAVHALDGQVIGYAYCNGGIGVGRPQMILPDDMAHWSPLPDPESAGLGMSWITPAVREIQGDIAATMHKLKFFENGATPNMVVKGITAANSTQFNDVVEMLERNHTGLGNAYRTLYLTAGADASVVGSDLKQIDFKATQGAGETRISILSRVPASLLGISEGLAGSSLNAGNFAAARRGFSDTWVLPTLQDLASCLSVLVKVPNDAELWFDTTDMTLLREDAKDAAEIAQIQMATIVSGVNGGFEPESVKAAVIGQNMALLKHSGLVSVQLQQPGAAGAGAAPSGPAPPPLTGPATEEDTDALVDAMAELDTATRSWSGGQAVLHPRGPGGKFKSTKDKLKESLTAHKSGGGGADPFDMFSREQLNRVAKARGVSVKNGAGKKDISAALLDSLHGGANPAGLTGGDGSNLHGVKKPAKPSTPERPAAAKPEHTSTEDAPGPTFRGGSLGDALADGLQDADIADVRRFLEESTNFTHPGSGMTATVRHVSRQPYGNPDAPAAVDVTYEIRDRDGNVVGTARRQWVPPGEDDYGNPRPVNVWHNAFELEPSAQGNGFARAWNEQMERTYRANGVREVHLLANEDVGGYAWAKQGYGWPNDDGETIADMAGHLERAINDQPPTGGWSGGDVQEMRTLLQRMRSGDPANAPTPLELSMVGWTPGAKTWPGKEFMLASAWEGVKQL